MTDTKDESDRMDVDEADETPAEREARADALKAQGNAKFASRDYRDAIALYSQAIELMQKAAYYGNRAACRLALREYKEALRDCKSALDVDPAFRKAYLRGVECLTQLGELDAAKDMTREGLQHFPSDGELKQRETRLSILTTKVQRVRQKLGDVAQRASAFSSGPARGANGDDPDSKQQDAEDEQARQRERELAVVLNILQSMLQSDMSRAVELRHLEVEALLLKGDFQDALSKATSLLRSDQQDVGALMLRAKALFYTQNAESAVKHVQTVLRKDPDNAKAKELFKKFKAAVRLKQQGNDAFKAGRYDEAVEKYTACLQLDAANKQFNAVLFNNRAAVWLKKKEYEKALADCDRAIANNDTYAKAYARKGHALQGLELYQEAVGAAERAFELDPSMKANLREAKVELKRSKRKNYYKILGVEKDADEAALTKGFRKKAMKWHPDRFASKSEEEKKKAEEMFKEIGEAYEVLKDPRMRQKYDQGYDLEEIKQGAGSGGFRMGGDISDILRMFGQSGGMGGMGGMGGGGFTFRFG